MNLPWLHILVAALAYFMLGAVWYSFLFQKPWIAYHQIDMNNPDGKKGVGAIMFASFVMMFVITAAISILMQRMPGLHGLSSGLKIGLITGLCFSAMAISITYVYLKKPLGLYLIDGLYHVCGQMAAAAVLAAWQ